MKPEEIKVWACPTCGYWRDEKRTGVHTAVDPDNPNGRMLAHELVETTYRLSEVSGAKK